MNNILTKRTNVIVILWLALYAISIMASEGADNEIIPSHDYSTMEILKEDIIEEEIPVGEKIEESLLDNLETSEDILSGPHLNEQSLNSATELENSNRVALPNGSLYSGKIKYGVIREGNGKNHWPNGDYYSGEWLNDHPHGQGEMLRHNKDKFRGAFAYGQYSGLGELTTKQGERYIGEFRFNRLDGLGLFVSANAEYYLGEFSQQKRHGRFLYFSRLSATPRYQVWIDDELEKVIDLDSEAQIVEVTERQLMNQMVEKFIAIGKKRLTQRQLNTHYQIRGRVRRIVSDVEDTPEHAYGDLLINLLDITE